MDELSSAMDGGGGGGGDSGGGTGGGGRERAHARVHSLARTHKSI